MQDKRPNLSVLLLTIGTGDTKRPEETLLKPLRDSMAMGSAARIVLLPSSVTTETAQALRGGDDRVSVEPLPGEGLENDVDACFAHFDRVITSLRGEGLQPTELEVDITRGTKAMSAALTLAAVRHGIDRLRYLVGDRDERGMVVPGTERVSVTFTNHVLARRRLDLARDLVLHGNFAAARELVAAGDVEPSSSLAAELEGARRLTMFYERWDRLDWSGARDAPQPDRLPADWEDLRPEQDVLAWIESLIAPESFPNLDDTGRVVDKEGSAQLGGRLTAEILSSARRRTIQGAFEDANLRLYRVTELVGQAALFACGYNSGQMPANDPDVATFVSRIRRKPNSGRDISDKNKKELGDYHEFPRDKVARFLDDLGHPIGKALIDLGKQSSVLSRNNSILIHGFTATGLAERDQLNALCDDVEQLLKELFPDEAPAWIEVARRIPPLWPAPPPGPG